jgi:cytoskeletal protein RodZ
MALQKPPRSKAPLGVLAMLTALVLAAFLGAAAGLVWQSADWFDQEPEEEVLTNAAGAD